MRYLKKPDSEPFETYSVSEEVQQTVRDIITEVRTGGDEAALAFTERFDGVTRDTNKLDEEAQEEVLASVSEKQCRIIDNSTENIREFAEAQLDHIHEFEVEIDTGITLGQKNVPIEKIGAYVPGGEYPLLSSALMAVVPAQVAGVSTIAVSMPPQEDGVPHPAAVYGALAAGADEIYVLGGAQAIAAMAVGTEEVTAVDKIVGPGNIFVTEAKKQLYGEVGIDLLAGPSEILVLGDDSSDPELIASDLLAQAEHDRSARPLLVTTSESLGNAVIREVKTQLQELSTSGIASEAWEVKGTVILTTDRTEATNVADKLAPEHLEIHMDNPRELLEELTNYGTLFIGGNSANVFSDKLIGTNHILPTQRAARYTAGLSVHMFLKHPTYQEVSDEGVDTLEPWATTQSVLERLEGHAKSSFIRAPGQTLTDYDRDTAAELPEE